MNFQVFGSRIKIFFLTTILFLILTIGMFIAFLVVKKDPEHIWFLMLFVWFGSATTLLFHYLLWQNLPFLQKWDIARENNFTFFLTIFVYVALFPVIAILSLIFLIIFTIAIFILWILNLFHKHKNPEYTY